MGIAFLERHLMGDIMKLKLYASKLYLEKNVDFKQNTSIKELYKRVVKVLWPNYNNPYFLAELTFNEIKLMYDGKEIMDGSKNFNKKCKNYNMTDGSSLFVQRRYQRDEKFSLYDIKKKVLQSKIDPQIRQLQKKYKYIKECENHLQMATNMVKQTPINKMSEEEIKITQKEIIKFEHKMEQLCKNVTERRDNSSAIPKFFKSNIRKFFKKTYTENIKTKKVCYDSYSFADSEGRQDEYKLQIPKFIIKYISDNPKYQLIFNRAIINSYSTHLKVVYELLPDLKSQIEKTMEKIEDEIKTLKKSLEYKLIRQFEPKKDVVDEKEANVPDVEDIQLEKEPSAPSPESTSEHQICLSGDQQKKLREFYQEDSKYADAIIKYYNKLDESVRDFIGTILRKEQSFSAAFSGISGIKDKWCCSITYDVMNIPVALDEHFFDLGVLLCSYGENPTHPYTKRKINLARIGTNRGMVNKYDEFIKNNPSQNNKKQFDFNPSF